MISPPMHSERINLSTFPYGNPSRRSKQAHSGALQLVLSAGSLEFSISLICIKVKAQVVPGYLGRFRFPLPHREASIWSLQEFR